MKKPINAINITFSNYTDLFVRAYFQGAISMGLLWGSITGISSVSRAEENLFLVCVSMFAVAAFMALVAGFPGLIMGWLAGIFLYSKKIDSYWAWMFLGIVVGLCVASFFNELSIIFYSYIFSSALVGIFMARLLKKEASKIKLND